MPRPPTNAELQSIADQTAWVRQRWRRIPNIWHCNFDGGRDDLRALDYVEYEGLDEFFRNERQTGYGKFALVFANVLVRQLGFQWVVSEGEGVSGLLLEHDRSPGFIDPVQLVRAESERTGWRCPGFRSLYERVTDALARGTTLSKL